MLKSKKFFELNKTAQCVCVERDRAAHRMGRVTTASFSYQKILKHFLDFPSHKIFRRIFLTLNKFIQKLDLNIYLIILIFYYKY